jgi:dynein assembly factor with WDR repeat domains 1
MIKVKRLLLRYYPPGIIIEYELDGMFKSRHLDLLDLDKNTNIETLAETIIQNDNIIPSSKKAKLIEFLNRLQMKLTYQGEYELSKKLKTHSMPITNCVFDKSGTK